MKYQKTTGRMVHEGRNTSAIHISIMLVDAQYRVEIKGKGQRDRWHFVGTLTSCDSNTLDEIYECKFLAIKAIDGASFLVDGEDRDHLLSEITTTPDRLVRVISRSV